MNQDPVFNTDMESELEYATAGWKTFYSFYSRLVAQGAPVELINQMADVLNTYLSLTEKIKEIIPKLPNEERYVHDSERNLRLAAESLGSPGRTSRGE